MDFQKFTLKAQEAVQKAQSLAETNGHGNIGNGHILKAIFLIDKDVLPYLLNKVNVDPKQLEHVLDKILESSGLVKGREYKTQVTAENAEGDKIKPDVINYCIGFF